MFETCTETVSVLYAIIFGAGDACIDISIGSLMWAFAAFMVVVVILQFGARKLWALVTGPARTPATERRVGTIYDDEPPQDVKPDEGPIRTYGR